MKVMVHILLIKFVAIVAFAMVCLGTTDAQTHPDAKVFIVSSETEDSIAFQISVEKKAYGREEDIDLSYVVKNRSGKNVYLILGPSSQLEIKELWIVELLEPVKTPNAHERYDYDLVEILPGKSYKGKLLIKAKELAANPKYDFGVVAIQAGFSYLFDISNLKGCKEAEYSLPCLSEVYKRSKTLTIGNLVVKRKLE